VTSDELELLVARHSSLIMVHGFLNIDKPAGITSHDVVARVRRVIRQKRVGHAGTLDPAATGVLVVALGAATRLIEYVQDATSKRYLATVRLGATTTTDDAEGEPLSSAPVPDLSAAELERALDTFRGDILQVPPMYSALHHQGRRLHELAREGIVVERDPRPVTIERLELVEWTPPRLNIDVMCSKGTYIRSLARDIGTTLGCGAYLEALRRTAVGTFNITSATPLAVLEDSSFSVMSILLSPEQAVFDWPIARLDDEQARRIRNGLPVVLAGVPGERARAHASGGSLLALLACDGDVWKPTKVFDWT
jgi:tRNA pseudouridine55 synthase